MGEISIIVNVNGDLKINTKINTKGLKKNKTVLK